MTENIVKRKTKKKKRSLWRRIQKVFLIAMMVLVIVTFLNLLSLGSGYSQMEIPVIGELVKSANADSKLLKFAKEHHLEREAWPDDLVELMKNNPDAEEFVLNYPLKKGEATDIDLSEWVGTKTVPQLYQWDLRWGYKQYSGDVMGLTGCGPTCLSMVSLYLLDDAKYTPAYIADFSIEQGYSVDGSGSAWALISEGGKKLGIDVVEIPLDEKRIRENLEVGNPIICIMGPGDFTTTGHFVVLTGYENGKLIVNDPNSKIRSEKRWDYDDIRSQIRGIWVCRK